MKRFISSITALVMAAAISASVPFTCFAENSSYTLDGKISDNINDNDYDSRAATVKTYIYENGSGNITRVEYIDGDVVVEEYTCFGQLLSSVSIEAELPVFGGFYAGSDYNFLVYGQNNTEESNDTEILRVVKYSKDFERIKAVGIAGGNTTEPFRSGSLRMTEADGMLYIHSCHRMFASDDGYNHQANMSCSFTIDGLVPKDVVFGVYTESSGYVSHSFNQYIQNDGSDLFRLDHGDAFPRSLTITKTPLSGSMTDCQYKSVFDISGAIGNNNTGVSAGGFELSDNNCIIAGNSVDQSAGDLDAVRNIFVNITDKSLSSSKTIFLTDYSDSSLVTYTPQLIKADGNHFVVMWNEYNESTGKSSVKALAIDESGNIVIPETEVPVKISDCNPVMCSDKTARWFVSDGSEVKMYALDPYDLNAVSVETGDVNGDGYFDAVDASLVLSEYARLSTGGDFSFSQEQITAADVDKNGKIDASDASKILMYYSYLSTGGKILNMDEWLKTI